jgi:hypothetical protein
MAGGVSKVIAVVYNVFGFPGFCDSLYPFEIIDSKVFGAMETMCVSHSLLHKSKYF